MADFFTAGWCLDPSRSADSTKQERRHSVEHALAKLGPLVGSAFTTTSSVEDAGKVLCCTAARCHPLRGEIDGQFLVLSHWAGDRLVTFRGALVLTRIAPFPDHGMSGFATATGDICAECLGVALQYFDLQDEVHYRLAPAVTLQMIDRSEVHRVSQEGRA